MRDNVLIMRVVDDTGYAAQFYYLNNVVKIDAIHTDAFKILKVYHENGNTIEFKDAPGFFHYVYAYREDM